MNTILVSLKRATDRREEMRSQLSKLDINAIIMDAVDGLSLSDTQLNKTIHNPGGWRTGEKFRPGEIGCTMSHIKAINIAKENNWEYVILLEDDIIICEDFNKRLDLLFKMVPKNWEHIFLSGHPYGYSPLIVPSCIPSTFKMSGTYSYILRNIAYEKTLNKLMMMEVPTDDIYEQLIIRDRKLISYTFFPFFTYPKLDYSYIWDETGDGNHPSFKLFKNKM